MKLKQKIFVVLFGLCFVLTPFLFALENNAEESLARGKRFYADGRYEEAMDNFVNVFVSGNSDQIAEANEYVNLIHFERGGVVPPKQVPYDAELEKRQNIGVQGKEMTAKTPKKPAMQQADDKAEYLTEIYTQEEFDDIPEPLESVPEADPFESQKVKETASEKETQAKEEDVKLAEGQQSEDDEFVILEGPIEVQKEKDVISNETSFPKGSKSKILSLQKKKEAKQKKELIDYLVARLNANEDAQVYMRGGRVDAIDLNSSAVFQGREVSKNASGILDDVYALMVLENSPAYVILPEGSYTDDVTLFGVRQAVALNSYLINRGMSPSKMNLNMGLTTQEPPEKFSNLAGTSIVFDYDGKSRLKSKLQEKNLPPVLSLAVYPFKEIVPAADEVFVIDFSVMEASSPIKEWVLQVVSHAADDHYYVVKQLSGDGALNHQTFWNGRKRYFGNILPLGKYTVVLRAKDVAGREKILKRQLILKEPSKKKETAVIRTESEIRKIEEVKKEEEAKALAKKEALEKQKKKESNLNYSQKRLWTMPAKKKVGEDDEIQSSMVVSTESSVTTSTQSTTQSATQTSTVYEENNTEGQASVSQGQETSTYTSSYGETSNPYENTEAGEESNPYEF